MGGGREVTENAGYWWRFSGWVGWNVHPLDTVSVLQARLYKSVRAGIEDIVI